MLYELLRRSLGRLFQDFGERVVISEQFAALQLFPRRSRHVQAPTQPAGDNFRRPSRLAFADSVEHAPEGAVDGDWPTGGIESAVVDEAEEEVEKPSAGVVVSPLHHEPQSRRPLASGIDVRLQEVRDTVRCGRAAARE